VDKPKNKLYTLSYFRTRLNGASIKSIRLINEFNIDNDKRYWTILVDPGRNNILVTCYKESSEDYYFSCQTRLIKNYIIKTKSMDIVIENIKTLLGVN
jgi:hypothetical protein